MNKISNRMICASHMDGLTLVSLYWDEINRKGETKEKTVRLDTRTIENCRKVENFLKGVRRCFLNTVVRKDSVYVVYSVELEHPQEIALFDACAKRNNAQAAGEE